MKLSLVIEKNPQSDAPAIARKMAESMRLYAHQTAGGESIGNFAAVGWVVNGDAPRFVPEVYKGRGGNRIWVCGIPKSNMSVAQVLQDCADRRLDEALADLKNLDGAFAIVYWDHKDHRLALITDFLGYQPLYTCEDKDHFLFASEIKAFSQNGLVSRDLDPVSLVSFLRMGSCLAGRTYLAGLKRAEAACVYHFAANGQSCRRETFWAWPREEDPWTVETFPYDHLDDVLSQSIRAYSQYDTPGTILMTGGFDSRLILHYLQRFGLRPNALTVRHRDEFSDMDGRLACQVAAMYDIPIRIETPDKNFFSTEKFADYLAANEGVIPSLYLFIPNLYPFISTRDRSVWEGLVVGLMVTVTRHGSENFATYLRHNLKLGDHPDTLSAAAVFDKDFWRGANLAFEQALEEEKGKYPDDNNGVLEFAFRNWTRHRTSLNPLSVLANHVLPFTPGLSRGFVELVARTPYPLKYKGVLMMEFYRRYLGPLGQISICSGGKFFYPSGKRDAMTRTAVWKESVVRSRPVSGLLRRLGWRDDYWSPSLLAQRLIEKEKRQDPRLDKATAGAPLSDVPPKSREALFYFSLWKAFATGAGKRDLEKLL